jgi:hypothetical protein
MWADAAKQRIHRRRPWAMAVPSSCCGSLPGQGGLGVGPAMGLGAGQPDDEYGAHVIPSPHLVQESLVCRNDDVEVPQRVFLTRRPSRAGRSAASCPWSAMPATRSTTSTSSSPGRAWPACVACRRGAAPAGRQPVRASRLPARTAGLSGPHNRHRAREGHPASARRGIVVARALPARGRDGARLRQPTRTGGPACRLRWPARASGGLSCGAAGPGRWPGGQRSRRRWASAGSAA